MVSFFGLKFKGDKKKKSDKSADEEEENPHEWKRIDQNTLGEGQYFGSHVGKPSVINGSVYSFPRPGTSQSMQPRPPFVYGNHSAVAAATSSMHELSNPRKTSFSSLRQTPSDANLRMNFANSSSTSLAAPGPGFSARPSTSGGAPRSKPWVSPLDVHFGRNLPASSLGQYELSPELSKGGDSGSLFGDSPEAVAKAIMDSIEKKEKDERERGKLQGREQERMARDLEQKREKENEMERDLEWQRKRVATAGSPPPSPGIYGSTAVRPRFQGPIDRRPGSRGGLRSAPMSPILDRPRFGGDVDQRPSSRGGMRTPVTKESISRPVVPQGQPEPPTQGSRGEVKDVPLRELERPVFQGTFDERPPSRGKPWAGPAAAGPTNDEAKAVPNNPANDTTRFVEPIRDAFQTRDVSESTALSSPTSPILPVGGDLDQWERPVIQNVKAMRDTLTISTPRAQSLTMKIEELEKSLIEAQQARDRSPSKGSDSSSHYSIGRSTASPSGESLRLARPPTPPFAAAGARRPQSPMRPLGNGQRPRRPNPEEYGVPAAQIVRTERVASPPAQLPAAQPAPRRPAGADGPANSPTSPSRAAVPPHTTAPSHTVPPRAAAPHSVVPSHTAPPPRAMAPSHAAPPPRAMAPSHAAPPPRATAPPHTAAPSHTAPLPRNGPPPRTAPPPLKFREPNPSGRDQENGPSTSPDKLGMRSNQEGGPPNMRQDSLSRRADREGVPVTSPDKLGGRGDKESGPPSMHPDKFTRPRPSPNPRPGPPNKVPNPHGAPPTPDSGNWPLSPIVTTSNKTPPMTQQPISPSSPVSLASPGRKMARPKVPPPLNFDFSPQGYSRAAGPFTPPPRRTTGDRDWPSSPEARRPGTAGLPPVATALTTDDDAAGVGLGLQIGVARGPSVREGPHGDRRPNHGLKSPTGIADNFGTGFI